MTCHLRGLTPFNTLILVLLACAVSFTARGTFAGEAIKFDVAEDPTRFAFNKSGPLLESGMPDYGNAFITQGYIYPVGTLVGDDPGVDVNGKPLYPDKVMGEWTCYGYMIGDGGDTKTGPWAITEQIYSFAETAGSETVVSNGYELVDINKPVLRAVTGGTGRYVGSRGEVQQTLLAITKLHSVTLRFEINLSDE